MRATDPAELSKAGMVPNKKRRCYQRRSGAPTRGTGLLRLALAGATRSGSAGVGSLARDPLARLRRVQLESIETTINFRPAVITNRDIAASAHACGGRRRCRRSRAHGPGMHAATKARPKPVPGLRWKRARALGLANGRQAGFDRFDRSQADLSAEGVD